LILKRVCQNLDSLHIEEIFGNTLKFRNKFIVFINARNKNNFQHFITNISIRLMNMKRQIISEVDISVSNLRSQVIKTDLKEGLSQG